MIPASGRARLLRFPRAFPGKSQEEIHTEGETMAVLKIGVTGSAGSGKSLVCRCFSRLGLEVFDCDRIAREVVEPGQPAYDRVVALFGPEVVGTDSALDRAGIRRIILKTPEKREALEAIVHPEIIREMVRQMETASYNKERACAVEVPLLFELGMESHFDTTLVVTADQGELERRISARDGVGRGDARQMLALQMDQAEKVRRADHVIENRGSESDLFIRLEKLYEALKKSA
jgi:dephospho-CoA kinase